MGGCCGVECGGHRLIDHNKVVVVRRAFQALDPVLSDSLTVRFAVVWNGLNDSFAVTFGTASTTCRAVPATTRRLQRDPSSCANGGFCRRNVLVLKDFEAVLERWLFQQAHLSRVWRTRRAQRPGRGTHTEQVARTAT